MGYHMRCDFCGTRLDGDFAELKVAIKRQRAGVLDARWAEEVRPTLMFCVDGEDRDARDRMGLESGIPEVGGCYDRALAMIQGTATESPNFGMEWRLVPVGAPRDVAAPDPRPARPGRGNDPRRTPDPAPVTADATLKDFYDSLAGAHRLKARQSLGAAGITTLDDVAAITDDQLMEIRGIGWAMRCKLRRFIEARDAARETGRPCLPGEVA